jgi:hypothetical protein
MSGWPIPGIQRKWYCQPVDSGFAMTLRRQDGDLNYEINVTQFAEATYLWLTQEDLISLAEGLR